MTLDGVNSTGENKALKDFFLIWGKWTPIQAFLPIVLCTQQIHSTSGKPETVTAFINAPERATNIICILPEDTQLGGAD